MHAIDHTVNQLHKRTGLCGTGGIRSFVSARPVGMTGHIGVLIVTITNDQFEAYESDLGMT